MLEQLLDSGEVWVYGSALLALVTVIVIGLPLLNRTESRARMDRVIQHRTELFEAEKQRMDQAAIKGEGDTARTVNDMMRVEGISGAQRIREKLLAAGIRRPGAVMTYRIAQIVMPLIFTAVAILLLSLIKKPLPNIVHIAAPLGAAVFGFLFPSIIVKNMADKRVDALTERFPDAMDLMLVCIEGGLSLEAAILQITDDIMRSSPQLGEEFGVLSAELAYLGDRSEALRNFAARIGHPTARSLANAFIQSEKYGTPLGQALRVMAADLREKRMAEAEAKAAALPPKLTVPMIAFFMPTLFVVLLGPAVIKAMATIAGMNR